MYAGNADFSSPQTTPRNLNIALDRVYVLSIPSFKWFRTSYTLANARIGHSCNAVGRQMISVGGYTFADNSAFLIPDVWRQGLGVFDMTEMVWKDSYDTNAAPYITPQMIKEDYEQNGRLPPDGFDDPSVESWFVKTCKLSTVDVVHLFT